MDKTINVKTLKKGFLKFYLKARKIERFSIYVPRFMSISFSEAKVPIISNRFTDQLSSTI